MDFMNTCLPQDGLDQVHPSVAQPREVMGDVGLGSLDNVPDVGNLDSSLPHPSLSEGQPVGGQTIDHVSHTMARFL